MNKHDINTKTEVTPNMIADMEAIGIEAQSGLLNYVAGFHANGAAASKRTEVETNKVKESESMSKKRKKRLLQKIVKKVLMLMLTRNKQ